MENGKKRIIVISVIIMIFLAGTKAFFVTSGNIPRIFGVNTQDSDNTGIDAASLSEVTLTFGLTGFEPVKAREILDEVEKKAKKELNIRLNFKWDSHTTINAYDLIKGWEGSGIQYDAFCRFDYSDLRTAVRAAIREGLVMNINELFPKYAPEYYKKMPREQLESGSFEGKLGIIPNNVPFTARQYGFVRDDLMKKYKIPEIKSFDDFDAYLKAVKENESGITPLYLNTHNDSTPPLFYDTVLRLFAEGYGYAVLDYGLGIVYKWDDPEIKLLAWEQTPEYKGAIERMKRLYDNGYVNRESDFFNKNKYSSYINDKLNLIWVNTNADGKMTAERSLKAYPLYPDKISQRFDGIIGGIAVSSKCKNPQRVLMFIEWLQSDQENYDLLMYGIKGRNYILYGEQFDFPRNAEIDDISYFNWDCRLAFMNFENERTNVINQPDLKKSFQEDVDSKSIFAPHAGFIPDVGQIEEIADRRAQSFCAVEELIKSGNFSDKTIEEFVSEQKKTGIGKLLYTIQKQLDDWMNEKKGKGE